MWYKQGVIYQIYPLGLCGAPALQDDQEQPRILRLKDWIPHLKKLGVKSILFNPLWYSDAHGYDSRDLRKLDPRLGNNKDFEEICRLYREAGFRLIFDAVFNHVGRGFWAFQDVLERREQSAYKDWFYLDFQQNSPYNDGLSYAAWESHYNLVKLNLSNPEVRQYLFDTVRFWQEKFGVSGLRLDVAYCLDRDFLKALHYETRAISDDFFLLGEIIHGDYKQIMNPEMCDSATNYECAKGLVSAVNSHNLFEIGHSLLRQFDDKPWSLYKDNMQLLSFVDNHDISRLATALHDPDQAKLVYGLMFAQPGIPALYYGSEWGLTGNKTDGDGALRPDIAEPEWNDLTSYLARLCTIRGSSRALAEGEFRVLQLANEHFIFERRAGTDRIIIAVNLSDHEVEAHFDAGAGRARELISGSDHDFWGGSKLPAKSCQYWQPY